jgi:signal transduction histidine kinase
VGQEPRTTDREVSELLLRTCHDLRTPLRSIRAHAELLLRGLETPPMSGLAERLGFIVDGARSIDLLVDGLASYAIALQIEKGSFRATAMEVLLRAVLAKLDKEIRDHEATVSYDKLPRVPGDPDRLMQVFENLLRNALRHRGQAPPRIHITAEKQAGGWLFAVRDNGPGVEPAYLETIFQPFERLSGKERPGPGLGLAICRAIVERHGGRIWAESNEGTGCTFFFTLPAD